MVPDPLRKTFRRGGAPRRSSPDARFLLFRVEPFGISRLSEARGAGSLRDDGSQQGRCCLVRNFGSGRGFGAPMVSLSALSFDLLT